MTTTSEPIVIPANHIQHYRQGRWTYTDYAHLADDGNQYEIVNGVLYMTPSPTWIHQEIVGRIYRFLSAYLEQSHTGIAFIAPLDVELTPNDIVQPDVFVLLNASRHKLGERHITGIPDLVIEVVSPGSSTYDRYKKNVLYARTGVPEYWIVDPDAQTVEVLHLSSDEYSSQGVFRGSATLPSHIVPGLTTSAEQFFISSW